MVEEHSGFDVQGEIKIGGATGGVGQVIKSAGDATIPTWGYADYGMGFLGTVTTATDATHFKASGLTGFGNGFFVGYYVYVLWDSDGAAGGAPQNEHKPISVYATADGTFTHTAFTLQLALDDKVLIVHPAIARAIDAYSLLGTPAADVSADIAEIKAVVDDLLQSPFFLSYEYHDDLASGTSYTPAVQTVFRWWAESMGSVVVHIELFDNEGSAWVDYELEGAADTSRASGLLIQDASQNLRVANPSGGALRIQLLGITWGVT